MGKDVKVTDFDISKVLRDGELAMTVSGTPSFTAPEVYLKTGYSFSADVWSFGMLLYEHIAGHLPYHDCEPRKIAAKVMAGELPVWPAEADASGTYKPLMKVAKR